MRHVSLALLLAALAAAPATAQRADHSGMITAEAPHSTCVLYAPDADDVYHGVNALRQSAEAKGFGPSATFDVTYTGFTAQARTAFQYAVDIWATHLQSSVPIRVDASFAPLGTNVLGSARASFVRGNFPGAPVFNTFYGDALADALAGTDLGGGGDDIVAQFSSNYSNWYFGTDGNPGTRVDFVSVVLHELGHGLGFFGSGTVDNGSGQAECNGVAGVGCYGLGTGPFPIIFDRFMEDASGVSMLNTSTYPNPSAQLGALLQSQDLYFDSPTAFEVYGNSRPPIWAPGVFRAGASFSHFDENVIGAGDVNALMTPVINPGEAFAGPGPLTCALFNDIGWPLGSDCAAIIVDDENRPEAVALALEPAGPNPFRSATAFRLRVPEPQSVRASLVDALGREVSVLFDGTASPGGVMLRVSGDLAPGVYTVLVEAEMGRTSVPLVRVR